MSDNASLLQVRNLSVSFRTEAGLVRAVDAVSLTVEPKQVLAIVGESGSGKSVSMLSVMGLLNDPNAVVEGEIKFKGRDLTALSRSELRAVCGSEISMIFQDPMTSLNPVIRSAKQIARGVRSTADAQGGRQRRALEMLKARRDPARRARASMTTRTSSRAACGSA